MTKTWRVITRVVSAVGRGVLAVPLWIGRHIHGNRIEYLQIIGISLLAVGIGGNAGSWWWSLIVAGLGVLSWTLLRIGLSMLAGKAN